MKFHFKYHDGFWEFTSIDYSDFDGWPKCPGCGSAILFSNFYYIEPNYEYVHDCGTKFRCYIK